MSFHLLKPILWVLVFFCLTEVALEVRAYHRGYATLLFPDLGAQKVAAYDDSAAAQWGPTLQFRFRSAVITRDKKPDTIRIWIASASHAEDRRLPVPQLFPSVLAERLAVDGRPVEVINSARAGNSIETNRIDLLAEADTWQPDLAVLYQMAIDLMVLSRQGGFRGEARKSEPAGVGQQAVTSLSLDDHLRRFLENLTIYTYLKTNFTTRLTAARLTPNQLRSSADERFMESVDAFVEAARSVNVQPVLCTFAMSHNAENLTKMPTDYKLGMLRHNPNLSIEGWVTMVTRWNGLIRQYGKDHSVPVIDLAEVVHGKPQYFRDAVHFTPEGHAKVAEVLAAGLAEIPGHRPKLHEL